MCSPYLWANSGNIMCITTFHLKFESMTEQLTSVWQLINVDRQKFEFGNFTRSEKELGSLMKTECDSTSLK